MPFVFADPGTHVRSVGRRAYDGKTYDAIAVRYGRGTGDTSEDDYVLYIDPVTTRLAACVYIVTYPTLLPEGITASAEHVLVYDEFTTVDGLLVPTKYTIYDEDRSVFATCTIRDWSFSAPFDEMRMVIVEGSVLDSSLP